MVEADEVLSDSDVEAIAGLHRVSIGDSIPALLGLAYLKRFYRFLIASEADWLFVERVDGAIASVCVLSLAPESAFARSIRGTLPSLALHAARALATSRDFRALFFAWLGEQIRSPGTLGDAPEITYVFTRASQRGRQLGQRLVARVEAFLATRGVAYYRVKTIDAVENRALAFYDENGFQRSGHRHEGGRCFVVFQKRLDAK